MSLPLDRTLSRAEAAWVGDFVHAGLEAAALQRPFAAEATWRRLTGLAATGKAFATAMAQLTQVQDDLWWRDLLKGARRIDAELPIVHRVGNELVSGSLDLLVERADGHLVVVDYKTTQFALDTSAPNESALRAFCHARGYDTQLNAYASAAAAMYPNAPVSACVYFTALRQALALPIPTPKTKSRPIRSALRL